jgi:ATP-dependent helicase HrpA
VPAGEEPLLDALERHLRSTTGVHVPRDAWNIAALAPHLRPTYRVVDEKGREQATGKDLAALKAPLRPRFERAMAEVAADSGVARTGETSWVFGDIDATATWTRAGHEVEAFPGLVDEGTTVGLQVFGSAAERDARHRLGLIRLLMVGLDGPEPFDRLRDRGEQELSNEEKLRLAGTSYPSVQALLADCLRAVVVDAVDVEQERGMLRSEGDYDALLARLRAAAPAAVRALVPDLLRVLDAHRETDRLLSGRAELALLPALSDMQAQLARLVPAGFVGEAGAAQLRRYPVYLAAIRRRREQLGEGGMAVARDRAWLDRVVPLQEAYLHRVDALPEGRPPGAALRQVRWQLEEFRVSLWAPQLGTAGKVSDVRIRKLLDSAA